MSLRIRSQGLFDQQVVPPLHSLQGGGHVVVLVCGDDGRSDLGTIEKFFIVRREKISFCISASCFTVSLDVTYPEPCHPRIISSIERTETANGSTPTMANPISFFFSLFFILSPFHFFKFEIPVRNV